jgi:hypothetical protein
VTHIAPPDAHGQIVQEPVVAVSKALVDLCCSVLLRFGSLRFDKGFRVLFLEV